MAVPDRAPASQGVTQMFRFLVESEELRTTPVRTLEGAARILWFEDLPRDAPGIASGLLASEDSDQWLRMERVDRTEPPLPPEELHIWVDLPECRDPRREEPPALLDTPLVPILPADLGLPVGEEDGRDGDDRRPVTLDEHPERDALRAAHAGWARTWSAWAERERVVLRRARLYEEVFRIHQEAVDLGESYELVLGFGHLAWTSEGHPVRRHLLTRRVVLSLDDRGTLEVGVDPDSLGFALEEDMLEVAQRLREEDRGKVLQHINAAAEREGTGAVEDLHAALREWAVRAAADAVYDVGLSRLAAGGNRPQVSFAPALVLRERPKRGQLNALTTIVETLRREGGEPDLLRHIVGEGGEAPADSGSPGTGVGEDGGSDHEELYFSLPSNAEQREIATRLRNSDLVVVQGPPGTGKTHTIANLVTDLLAHGQRILITSHTTRALKVLKDKLPEEIRPLAVSRTGDGVEAQRELEASVRAILERQSQHDDKRATAEVARLQARLEQARTQRDHSLKDLRAIRERETHIHPEGSGGYGGTLSQIARKLVDDEAAHSWLGPVPEFERKLTAETVHTLLAAARAFTPEQRAIAAEMPEAGELPDPVRHAQAVEEIRRADRAAAAAADVWDTTTEDVLKRLSREESARMRALLADFTTLRDRTRRLNPHWAEQRSAVLAGRDRQVRTQAERLRGEIRRAETELAAIADTRIDGLDAFALPEALRHATALKEGFDAGRRLKGAFGVRTRLYKDHAAFLEGVTVDGSALDTPEELALVHHRIALERRIGDALRAAGRPAALDWSDPLERLALLREDLDDLGRLLKLSTAYTALAEVTDPIPALAALDWADDTRVDRLGLLLAAVDARHDAVPARELIASALSVLRTWSDRTRAREETEAAASPLGRARTALEDADTEAYERALADMERARAAHRLEQEYRAAERAVAEHHRGLAAAVTTDPGDERWEGRLKRLGRAWAWSAWNQRLAELTDPRAEEACRARLDEADGEVRLTMGRLAAAKAWKSCLSRLTADQEVALRAYQQSIRRIGKGTGRHAARHQRQARESLRECQPAVPAWIMPLYQVVSTVPMDRPGAFDVVIIDEASQSGPEALLLAWLGKRLVVVGDDKQVSPRNAGLDQDQLFALQERRLASFPAPRRNLFAPNNSLFDIAAGLAGSRGQLMLSEHFRCMPEIIGFSNEEFYQGRLQPLRQYAADRLPPVRTVHVADGMLEGKGQKQVNRAEARALVAQVVRCCADPAYEERSMGVVTLLGTAQQALIEEMLTDVLPLDVRVERQIRVGNASAFQGDERDVMFLGCVYAPFDIDGQPRRPSPFSSVPDQQIINVAASRARDQVWVFHSFALSDLGETDMRRRYLDHLSRPAEDQIGTGLGEVPADERVEPFDSLFEQRVYRALHERGYRVRPQYRAGRYRIDLVVEGGTRRLAVECDGDAYHTEENAPDDAARQRELERVGWTFVRIRGSRFFRDPQESLNPLWKQLEAMGIEPARA